jgi:hypothetical protein
VEIDIDLCHLLDTWAQGVLWELPLYLVKSGTHAAIVAISEHRLPLTLECLSGLTLKRYLQT